MKLTCDVCAKEFNAGRADARYCSGRCRTIAYRRRTSPPEQPRRRRPLNDTMRDASLDLDRIVRRWVRLAEDDRFPRQRSDLVRHRSDLVRARDALDAILEHWATPVTDDSAVTNLAIPQPARRGRRRKHNQIINNALISASGLCIGLDGITALDGSIDSEEAAGYAAQLGEIIGTMERVGSMLSAVTPESAVTNTKR